MDLHEEEPEVVSHGHALAYLLVNINAVSSIVLEKMKRLFRKPLKRPDKMNRLMEELNEVLKGGNLILPCPRGQGFNSYTASKLYANMRLTHWLARDHARLPIFQSWDYGWLISFQVMSCRR